MANTPIVKIPIDDSAFKRFLEAFEVYSKKVEELPKEWRQLDEAMGATQKTVEAMDEGVDDLAIAYTQLGQEIDQATQKQQEFQAAASGGADALALAATSTALIVEAIKKATGHQKEATKGQKDFSKDAEKSATHMERVSKATSSVAHGLLGVGNAFLRFATFGGILGGLAGIAGGVGVFDLAGAATSRSRNARGLGLTPGQLSAFQTNLSPFVGSGVLSGAANAQVDLSKYGYLATLGVNPAGGGSAAQIAIQEIEAVRRAWKANPTLNTAQAQAALQLGFTAADIRNVGTADRGQLAGFERGAIGDAGALGFSPKVAAEWTRLDVQLKKAGITIESSLIEGLAPLAPQLSRLSDEFSGMIAAFFKSGDAKEIIADVTSGLKWLGDEVSSPAFQGDLKDFGTNVIDVSKEIAGAIKWLRDHNPFASDTPAGDTGPKPPADYGKTATAHDNPASNGWVGNAAQRAAQLAEAGARRLAGDYAPANIHAFAMQAEKAHGLPAGMMDALAKAESGTGKSLFNPNSSAVGVWQFLRGTYQGANVDPLRVDQESDAAGGILQANYQHFHDWRKAVAAYVTGGHGLDKILAAHPKDWEAYLPRDAKRDLGIVFPGGSPAEASGGSPAVPTSTHAKLDKIVEALDRLHKETVRQRTTARVTVQNSTSARVAVQTNAASGGP